MVEVGQVENALTSTFVQNAWSRKGLNLASQAENASSILVARSNIDRRGSVGSITAQAVEALQASIPPGGRETLG